MSKSRLAGTCLAVAIAALAAAPAKAGVVVYSEGDRKIEIGGQLQVQYQLIDPDCDSSITNCPLNSKRTGEEDYDRVFFRRLRPYIAGSITKDWFAKIQFDFGEALDSDEVSIKDVYISYSGWENRKITMGNAKHFYSREFITSSETQQLVERSFPGDHNYGSPDRVLGIKFDHKLLDGKVGYGVGIGAEHHDPDARFMDFDSPTTNQSDWNEGFAVTGRVDWHPLGALKYDQADFNSDEWKFTVSVGGYSWRNDDDNNTYTDPNTGTGTDPEKADLDKAYGWEISGGLRGHGFGLDAEYHVVHGETVDPNFSFDPNAPGGIYEEGEADLTSIAFEGGYMLPNNRIELVAGWDRFDADTYEDTFDRTSVGLNWYWSQHNAKLQITYQMVENFLGVPGQDNNVLFVQTQFVY